MKKLLLILTALLAFACGGIDDISNPDYHNIQVSMGTGPDGDIYIERDLGFDAMAYLQEQDEWSDSAFGQLRQALTTSDRYGIDSGAAGGADESRCPVGGYTSGTKWCGIGQLKARAFYVTTPTLWPLVPGQGSLSQTMVSQVSSIGGGMGASLGTVLPSATIRVATSSSCGGATSFFGCSDITYGSVVLSGSKRYRKNQLSTVTTINAQCLLNATGNCPGSPLNASSTQTQKNRAAVNTGVHEMGHVLGFGHDSSLLSNPIRPATTMHATWTEVNSILPWSNSEKAEAAAYVP